MTAKHWCCLLVFGTETLKRHFIWKAELQKRPPKLELGKQKIVLEKE